jgi:hypothetical protein
MQQTSAWSYSREHVQKNTSGKRVNLCSEYFSVAWILARRGEHASLRKHEEKHKGSKVKAH